MPESPLRLIKRCAEFLPKDQVDDVPGKRRGLYVLYREREDEGRKRYDVVYVGMATLSILLRLRSHAKTKGELWTHFSAFEVWDNIRDEEIRELEGLFRHIYRKDSRANELNIQKNFKKAARVRKNKLKEWTSAG
jgi:hypothetical protein